MTLTPDSIEKNLFNKFKDNLVQCYRQNIIDIFYKNVKENNVKLYGYDVMKIPIYVRLIHYERDMCFNCDHREILYAIRDCFDSPHTVYKESYYGKALNIPIMNIPSIPPFKNILYYYHKHFLDRLSLIDIFINDKLNMDSVKAILLLVPERLKVFGAEKKALYKSTFAYNAFYITNLPGDILKNIYSYLYETDFNKCLILRHKYECLRKDTWDAINNTVPDFTSS